MTFMEAEYQWWRDEKGLVGPGLLSEQEELVAFSLQIRWCCTASERRDKFGPE